MGATMARRRARKRLTEQKDREKQKAQQQQPVISPPAAAPAPKVDQREHDPIFGGNSVAKENADTHDFENHPAPVKGEEQKEFSLSNNKKGQGKGRK